MGTTPMNAAQNAQQQNQIARMLIKQQATDVRQIIYTNTITNPAASVLNIPVRPVGLVLGFWVEIVATVNNASAGAMVPTDFGPLNVLSQVSFVDLNNFTRIQTTGAHIGLVNTARQGSPYGAALFSPGNAGGSTATVGFDNTQTLGSNWYVWFSTPSVAAAGNATVKVLYYVPLAYSKNDLRGAIYAGVINATMQLGLTFNAFPAVATGADSTNAIYIGSTGAASITSAVVTVTQHYLDQLPLAKNGYPVLPTIDTNTVYELKNTFLTGLANGQDFAIPYTNYRDFLSVFLVYNDGTAGGGRPKLVQGVNSNLNYLAVQTANFFNPIKNTPYLQAALYRNKVGTDLQPGTYYFPSREKPVSTTQAGNQQIILNPANLGSTQTPYVQAYFEDFGVIAALTQAGSLASS